MSNLEQELYSHIFGKNNYARAIISDNINYMKELRESLYHNSGVNVSFSAENSKAKFGFLHYENTSLDEKNIDGALEAVNHLLGYHHLRNETTELKADMEIIDNHGIANIELYISSFETEIDKIQEPDNIYNHQMEAYIFSNSKVMSIRITSEQTYSKDRINDHFDIIQNIIGYVKKNKLIEGDLCVGISTKHNLERDPFNPILYSKISENKDKYKVLRSSEQVA